MVKSETVTALAELVPKEICRQVDLDLTLKFFSFIFFIHLQVFDIYCSPLEGGEVGEYSVDKDKVSRYSLFQFLDV